ncbi:MAG: hypothetical protein Q9202_007525 [Teloschistes flavicans]
MSDSPPQTVEEITSTGKDCAPEEEKVEIRILEIDATKGKYGTTQRGLKSRHIQFIALGGCIGTTVNWRSYWPNSVPVAVWITIFLGIIVALNIFVVSWYGESEFWFASIKILGIVGLIILGIVLFFGGGPNRDRLGFRYWQKPGAFIPFAVSGTTGKFLAFWTGLIRSGYAFVMSPEMIALAAGETEAPRRNIPKASRRFVYRLAFFYILGTLVISVIVASNDDLLLHGVNSGKADAGASPFVIGIKRAGIRGLDHVVNADAFQWFVNLTTTSGYIAWIILLITYLRFRRALEFNEMLDQRPYKSPGQPYATYFALVILSLLTLTNGFHVFLPGKFTPSSFLAAYITLPIVLTLYLGHKLWHRTPLYLGASRVDIRSGKEQADRLEELDTSPIPKNIILKMWFWIA